MAAFEKERTLIILKPDAIQRALIGEILRRVERTGLKFTAFKFLVPTRNQVLAHYNKDEAWCKKIGQRVIQELEADGIKPERSAVEYGKEVLEHLVTFMTAGPVLVVVVEGNEAVAIVAKLVGSTEPKTSDVGTIRGDLTVDSYGHATYRNSAVRNLIHCSESPEEAEREIGVWFSAEEIVNYRTIAEKILYDVNLDGILE
ncbi:MAG: nucleoside-diphosphate kinase [Candidatus Parcubacteria bacterium]|nr:MAG: nucleoside-diphosphate kinase [Candidatus Parcubacteria bacterium]